MCAFPVCVSLFHYSLRVKVCQFLAAKLRVKLAHRADLSLLRTLLFMLSTDLKLGQRGSLVPRMCIFIDTLCTYVYVRVRMCMLRPTLAPQPPPPSISYSRFNSPSSPLVSCLDRVAAPSSSTPRLPKKVSRYHGGIWCCWYLTREQQCLSPDCE